MPNSVLTKWRSLIARTTVLAVLASMLVIGAAPAGAAVDTTATCPSNVPSAGFTDVAGLDAKAQKAIDCLKFYGISAGTSATTFSPNTGVARWQMAIFLIREAEDHGIVLPSGADQGFTDIASLDATAQKAINQIKQLGVTAGTSATTFGPNDIVPRWQMAIFLVRLAEKAGVALPSGAPQGFTDIASLSSAAQTAINQAKQLGITDGFSATTFSPNTNVLRWQMALFIIANMAVDGVVPTGLGFPVVGIAGSTITYFDAAAGVNKTVTFAATDSFKIDGVVATMAAFTAAVTPGDLLSWTGTTTKSFNLTNQNVAGNLVSNVLLAADTVDIVDSVTGTVLQTYDYTPAGTVQYKVDGTTVILAQFEADLNAGDTIGVTGAGTATNPFVVALTNQTASGSVVDAAGTFMIKVAAGAVIGPFTDPVAGDVLTLNGAAGATAAAVIAAMTTGDTITYAMRNGIATIVLTDAAPSTLTGEAVAAFATPAFSVVVGGAVVPLSDATDGVGPWQSLIVNGSVATVADFEAALSPGDVIAYRVRDAATSTTSLLQLTDAGYSGTPAGVDTTANTLSVFSSGKAGPALDTVNYDVVDPDLKLTLGTGGAVKWTVDGASATVAQFEAAVNSDVANNKGTVSVAKVGVDIVWSVTTS